MTSSYRVDAQRIEHTLAVLQEERELAQQSRFGRITFLLLQIAVYSVPIGILLMLLLSELSNMLLLSELGEKSLISCAIVIFQMVAVLSLVPLLLINLPTIRTIVRQVRLERKVAALLGADDGALWTSGRAAAWNTPQTRGARGRRWVVLGLGWLMTAVIAFYAVRSLTEKEHLPVAVAVALLLGIPVFFIFTRRRVSQRFLRICLWVLLGFFVVLAAVTVPIWRADAVLPLITVLLVIVLPLLLLISNRLLARVRERLRLLDDVEHLSRSLDRQRQVAADEERDFVELAAGEAERLADLEAALNRRSQLVAIDRAEAQRSASYTTLRTHELRVQMEELDPHDRLRVESGIEELSYDPGIDTASEAESGVRHLPVADTDLELVYRVDDELRQVNVLAIESAFGRFVPDPQEGGHD